ncbi:MAG: prolyl oligopeptidase family serine peptidase [Acidobacteria bacterium]|nr:prolyl oligopeptidase family serine peptidase [Acidobacteriota bacterium]
MTHRLLLLTAATACLLTAQQPPLLDRELFFGDPEISGAQISPDGAYITFMRPYNNVRNIWIKKAAEPFSEARPLTTSAKRPIPTYFWTRDSKFLLFIQDNDGDENFNVYALNPKEEKPEARNLTNAKGVRTLLYASPKNDPDTFFIGINDRDKAWHDLYRLKVSTGEKTLLRGNTERISGWNFDLAGNLRLAERTNDKGDTEILRVDPDGFKTLYSCSVLEGCGVIRFHKDGKRAYMQSNAGANVDLTGLYLMDVATGKTELVETDPNKRVDFGNARFSEVTDELVLTTYVEDRVRIYWKDKAKEADYRLLQKRFAGKEVSVGGCTKDESRCLVVVNSDTDPGEVYLFDRASKKTELQYKIREKIPRDALAAMESIRYKSSDGLEIPAYLTIPKGAKRPMPLVVLPHGGPWGRDVWGYNGLAQFLANRGYAVLQPNFRASTGFGKRFLNLGNGKWGETMQDDLTFGVKHLVANGTVDSKRVGILGGSYGGYATLAGVAFTPDLYAAGVAIVAPSNLITLLDSIPPYWEAGRTIFHTRMGNPGTPEGKAQLMRQSPLNSAAKIKSPLMVVQGANDPRVNQAESDQIVIALRDRNFPVEYLVAPDEGHGFQRPVNNLAMFLSAEKFLAKHLGGLAQEDTKPEVTTRLKEITVDPKTVKLKPKGSSAGVAKPVTGLTPGVSNYVVTIAMGERKMTMQITSTIKEEGGTWRGTDVTKTPNGDVEDSVVLAKDTLHMMKRSMKQGPAIVQMEVKDGKLTGSLNMGGQERPINVDLPGPLFADGGGSPQALGTLPLAAGYKATFHNFDLMKQKPKLMQLEVSGEEKVTIPAGTFDAWKVEVSSTDGGNEKISFWIDTKTRKYLKSTGVLAQFGGATMTAELQP